jgi:CDP-glycerol glycerophosphotransferase
MYRRSARRIDVIPAASHLVRGRLESAFGLAHEKVVVTGEPRVDVLSRGDTASRRSRARALVAALLPEFSLDRTLVLYAPTWRNGDPDPGVPNAREWADLLEVLERHDAALVVRSHRLGEGEYAPPIPTDRVAMLGSGLLTDVNRALPAFDAIVTDYSSLAYDSSLVPLPAFFLAPDLDEYARRRGFYGVYADIAGDDVAQSWGALIPELDEALGDAEALERRTARARALSARVHDFADGHNTRRVIDEIFARIGKARA